MGAHKRTEITIETERILTIRRRRSIRLWCSQCGFEVEAMGQEEAAAFTGMSGQALRDSARARGWHLSEGPDGAGLICLKSMLDSK
jgi:hypothetical protein